ncbi:MAG: hypothetical protein M3Y20_07430 [Actinomycetota bacterium]|nr:hypothetical protein [Actinomycetota bacterium]
MADHIIGGTPYGRGDALVDASGAVLLDRVDVVLVSTMSPSGAGRALALELGGRVNKTTRRSSVLYVMDQDGAAAIVSELLGLAARVSPSFLDDLLTRVRDLP